MPVIQISRKGQILIPSSVRKRVGFKPGGKAALAEEAGRVTLTPVPEDPIDAATGFLEGKFSLTSDLLREHREEARRERRNRSR